MAVCNYAGGAVLLAWFVLTVIFRKELDRMGGAEGVFAALFLLMGLSFIAFIVSTIYWIVSAAIK